MPVLDFGLRHREVRDVGSGQRSFDTSRGRSDEAVGLMQSDAAVGDQSNLRLRGRANR